MKKFAHAYTPPSQRDKTEKDAVHARLRDAVKYHLQRNGSRQWLMFSDRGLDAPDIALHLFPEDHSLRLLFDELKLNETDPLHWRSLLDALADNFVEHRGASYTLGNESQYELALDIYELHHDMQIGPKARYAQLARSLRTISPYSERWGNEGDRAFEQRVTRLIKAIDSRGIIDDAFRTKAALRYRRTEPNKRFVFSDEDAQG